MSMDDFVGQIKRGVDRGVKQVKRTAETVEAEAKIFALHRKVGLRVYQLWRAGQLTHPDLEEDLEQISKLEARVDEHTTPGDAGTAGDGLGQTQVTTGGMPASSVCPGCSRPVSPDAQFCTHCGRRQG